MAVFGCTHLSYQNPHPAGASHSEDSGLHIRAGLPPSFKEHQEPTKRPEESLPAAPHQLYTKPLTDNQQYGWVSSKSPKPWTQVKRFPRKNSEMTKFVKQMSSADRDFSLF